MAWVDCPKCSEKDTCEYYKWMKLQTVPQIKCVKGCK